MEDIIIKPIDASTVFVDTDRGYMRTIAEHFTFYPDNYQWSKAFKNKLWDGKIRLFNVNTAQLPYGLVQQLLEHAKESKKSVFFEPKIKRLTRPEIVEDVKRFLSSLVLPKDIEVRDYQEIALIDHIEQTRSIIISPTGSGKSLLTYLILRYYLSRGLITGNGLIIVPTINLVTQLFKDFKNYAQNEKKFDVEELFHLIYSGQEKTTNKKFIISTWQSLQNIKNARFFQSFDIVFCDEVHTAEADVLPKIIDSCTNAYLRIGLTGTLKESKMKPLQLIGLFGNIIKTKTTRELMDMGYLPDVPILAMQAEYSEDSVKEFWTEVKAAYDEAKKKQTADKLGAVKYAAELRWLRQSKKRNTLIIRTLQKLKNENNLLLFRSVEHAAMMEEVLTKMGFKVLWMKQQLKDHEREKIRQYVEQNDGVVILSTYQIFQLGISINNLDNVIFCAPSKGRIRVLQSFGRILRKSKTGKIGYLIDIIDDLRNDKATNTVYSHGLKRLEYYAEEKLKIKYIKVKL